MKRIISSLLTAMFLLSLTACGAKSASMSTDSLQGAATLVPLTATASHPFLDVPEDAAYSDAIVWCYA